MKFIDGDRYLVTYNNGLDCVEATYIAEHNIFSFLMGSLGLNEVEKVETITN